MLPKGAFLHVGANTNPQCLGRQGPIFGDGTFKYIPIPEGKPSARCPTYDDLGLAKYIPSGKEKFYVHNDPEFKTFTYGDYLDGRARTRQIAKLNDGDYLLFLASLRFIKDEKERLHWVNPKWSYYVIGYFELDKKVPNVEKITPEIIKEFGNNAHVIRGESGFAIFKGNKNSTPLKIAVPFSDEIKPNDLAMKVLLEIKGLRWWGNELIYGERLSILLNEIKKKNPDVL